MTRAEVEQALAGAIAIAIREAIESQGQATILVSGGSTPVGLFAELSTMDVPWEKVQISLVDERLLPDGHPDQNGTMVRKHLLRNKASKAEFKPLVVDSDNALSNLTRVREALQDFTSPYAAVVLGMGTDGHTASLFPDMPELEDGMNLENAHAVLITNPVKAPYQRISHIRRALLNTRHLFLHLYGEEKKQILEEATSHGDYRIHPIAGFINRPEVELSVFWAA